MLYLKFLKYRKYLIYGLIAFVIIFIIVSLPEIMNGTAISDFMDSFSKAFHGK